MKPTKGPVVSVIIPTYNREQTISRAIESILNQTYQDFEIIIVDDGSTDNTKKLIHSFKDSRIQYIQHEHNKGPAAARNTGIKSSKGRYVAFQDSDDESLPYRLEKEVEVLNCNSKIEIVYGDMIRVFQDGYECAMNTPDMRSKHVKAHHAFISLKAERVGIGTCVIRRSCFEEIGYFDTNLHRFEELDFFIRASESYHLHKIDTPVIKYHEVHRDEDKTLNLALSARKYLLGKYYKDISTDRTCLAIHYFGIGNDLCYLRNIREGRQYIWRSIQLSPLKIKYLIALLMSFAGPNTYHTVVKQKNKILLRVSKFFNR
jgi:glycosyltransferase involved in cell wall biosynthesis